MKNRVVPVLLAWMMVCVYLVAAPVSERDVIQAVTGWLNLDDSPLGASMNAEIADVQMYSDHDTPLFYAVSFVGGGYVVTSADDMIQPVIAFSRSGVFDNSDQNPLLSLLRGDMQDRVAVVTSFESTSAAPGVLSVEDNAALQHLHQITAQWQLLMNAAIAGEIDSLGIASVSDLRVSPFIQSRWGQSAISGVPVYNIFTPENYSAGCVATAMAQVMRYHEYPVDGIGVQSNTIEVDSVARTASTRGGDGAGGGYIWSFMPCVTSSSTSLAGYQSASSTHTIGTSVDLGACGNVWGADFALLEVGTPKILASVAVSGSSLVYENSSEAYTCTAYYSDGRNAEVTSTASWSENSSYASINGSGLLTAVEVASDQAVTISVAYTEGGITKTDTHSVTIKDVPAGALYSGGAGTAADPYRIAHKADLLYLGTNTAHYSKHFIMTADIDLNGMVLDTPLIDTDWLALYGEPGVLFTGVFDGGGFVISNFTANSSGDEGAYGCVVGAIDFGGVIQNLGVEASVMGEGWISIGGLCGHNRGVISNCFFNGSVIGGNYGTIAGLCSYNEGLIRDSYSSGSVHNDIDGAGGLCGDNRGSIYRCWSSCDVLSGEYSAGGLCGGNSGEINECFSTGRVEGYTLVGGLCGYMVDGLIYDCYATGEVAGQQIVGGFFGGMSKGNGVISNCYSIGVVSGISSSGGFCARPEGVVVDNCYFYLWSGLANGLGVALEQGELAVADSYAGFDFSGTSLDGTNDLWTIVDGHSPQLSWQAGSGPDIPSCTKPETTLAGQGVADDPFIIADLIDLYEFAGNTTLDRGCFKLISDLNLAGTNFNASFINREFGGVFDGDGHRIKNVSISATNTTDNQLGFFSRIVGSVFRLGLVNVSISGGSEVSYVGALCGNNGGTVDECFASGSVEGRYAVGGFCGYNAGDIRNSYSTVNVAGLSSVGGFCGVRYYSLDFFANCYATGSVAGNTDFGGFCGSIFNEAAAVTNCFWDVQTSGTAASSGGIGKTTAEMQMQSTFTDAGWNFQDVWGMNGYPVLRAFRHTLQVESGTGQGEYALDEEIAVCADAAPVGYALLGWNIDPPEYSNNLSAVNAMVATFVMPYADVVLTAEYCMIVYEVTFDLGEHGTHAGGGALVQSVNHGSAAAVPVFNVDPGWTFTGWSVSFSNVTENLAVTASYAAVLTSLEIEGSDVLHEMSGDTYRCWAYYSDGSSREITDLAIWFIDSDLPGVECNDNEITVHSITNSTLITIAVDYSERGVRIQSEKQITIINLSYSSGSGTVADPYRVATKADLMQLATTATDYDKHFLLIDDIDLTGEAFTTAIIAASSSTVFYSGTKFTGVFDGGGHVIRNLSIDSLGAGNDYLALFGYLDAGAVVCNLSVVDSVITGAARGSAYIGGICGYNKDSVISNCFASVTAAGNDYIGGICGRSEGGTFVCSYSAGSVSGDDCIGGLCGRDTDGSFANCYASAAVSGDDYVGGLGGYLYRSGSQNCYSSGSVVGDSYSGGFAGRVYSASVNNCFWDTQTSGYATSAAGAGRTTAQMQAGSTFTAAGWNFANTWYMDGYPALRCFNKSGTYAFWLMNNASIPAVLRAESDAPAGDCIPNLLKYACGLPAMDVCTTADLMTIDNANGAVFSIRYHKSKAAGDVTLNPVWAETLSGPWNTSGIATELVGGDAEREQWKASIPLEESGFIRLRVERKK